MFLFFPIFSTLFFFFRVLTIFSACFRRFSSFLISIGFNELSFQFFNFLPFFYPVFVGFHQNDLKIFLFQFFSIFYSLFDSSFQFLQCSPIFFFSIFSHFFKKFENIRKSIKIITHFWNFSFWIYFFSSLFIFSPIFDPLMTVAN